MKRLLIILLVLCPALSRGQAFTEITLSNFMDNVTDTTKLRLSGPLLATNPGSIFRGDASGLTNYIDHQSASVGGNYDLDMKSKEIIQWTLTVTNDVVFILTNALAGDELLLTIIQDTNGNHAVRFTNSSFAWAGGTVPAFPTNASVTNLYMFLSDGQGRGCLLHMQTNIMAAP